MTWADRRAGLPAAVLLGLLAGCVAGPPDTGGGASAGPSTGRLVIVGGALQDDNADVYHAIVAGRDGDGPLCVLPTASGVPRESMDAARTTLGTYVGDSLAVGVFLTVDNAADADDPAVVASLERCSGFFFTGGDQSRVVDTFLPGGDTTRAFRALRRRWEDGAVVSGSSAGAAMMSGVMIASGSSAGALEHGVVDREDRGGVWIRRGMGFFERAILDQHFLSRGRIGRLVVAVLATDSLPVGLGIDENTALVVDGAEARVVGASGVVVVDGRRARRTAPERGTGVRLWLAGSGDRIDLGTFAVTRGEGKSPVDPSGGSLERPEDPFARWAFLHLLAGLAAASDSAATFQVSGAGLSVREADGFTAAADPGDGVQGEPRGFSAGPYLVDLEPAGTD